MIGNTLFIIFLFTITAVSGGGENISNEFQIYFETHFLLLETLLDRNKLTDHFLVKPNSRSELYKSNSNQPHLAALPMTYSCSESS